MSELWADEDLVAHLEDLIKLYQQRTDSGAPRKLKEAQEQLQFLQKKIETGDGTCGAVSPFPNCMCESCRFAYGKIQAPDRETAIARRPLVEGQGYIHVVRNKRQSQ